MAQLVVPSQTALAYALREPNLLVPGRKPIGPVALNVPGVKVAMLFQRDFFDLATAQVNETYASPTGSWTSSSGGFAWDVADDSDNSIPIDYAASITGDFLVSVEFKSNHSGGDGNGIIFAINSNSGDSFVISRVNWSNDIRVSLTHNSTGINYTFTGFSDGEWQHLVAGRLNNCLVAFVGGVEVHNTAHSVEVQDLDAFAQIGATAINEPPITAFNGEIASFLMLDHRGASSAVAKQLSRDLYSWLKPANDAPYLFSIPGATSNAPTLGTPVITNIGQTTADIAVGVTF